MLKKLFFENGFILLLLLSIGVIISCAEPEKDKLTRELTKFIAEYEKKVIPVQDKYNMASYLASTTGNEGEYKAATELQVMLSLIYANKENYSLLKKIKESKLIEDTLLARQLDVLYHLHLPYQFSEDKLVEIINLENEIKREYETFRPIINEKEVSDNKIEEVLRISKDAENLEKYWRASKKIGRLIDNKLINLVKLRNEAAKALNFNNYHEMMLIINGQDPKKIEAIFNDLDVLTKGPYEGLKKQIDEALAIKYNLAVEELKPWHYQNRYFQKAPIIFDVDFTIRAVYCL